MLKWLLLASLAFVDPEVSISVPTGLFGVINDAQNETNKTVKETIWCLVGEDNGTDIFVSNIVKAEQETYVGYKVIGDSAIFVSQVKQTAPCPKGTIGDLHTHPWHSDPSKFDMADWVKMAKLKEGENWRFHGVSAKLPNKPFNMVRFFVVEGNTVYEIGKEDGTPVIIGPRT